MRLMHPVHGWHEVSAADDIPAMRKAGWVDDDGKALAAKLGLAAAPVAPEGDAHIALTKAAIVATFPELKRGPGRPKKG